MERVFGLLISGRSWLATLVFVCGATVAANRQPGRLLLFGQVSRTAHDAPQKSDSRKDGR